MFMLTARYVLVGTCQKLLLDLSRGIHQICPQLREALLGHHCLGEHVRCVSLCPHMSHPHLTLFCTVDHEARAPRDVPAARH